MVTLHGKTWWYRLTNTSEKTNACVDFRNIEEPPWDPWIILLGGFFELRPKTVLSWVFVGLPLMPTHNWTHRTQWKLPSMTSWLTQPTGITRWLRLTTAESHFTKVFSCKAGRSRSSSRLHLSCLFCIVLNDFVSFQ